MNVTLISHTPEPERLIASAAKLCYSASSIGELRAGLDVEKSADFVKMLASLGHASPIEHVTFTFGIEGVSRTLMAQITRHRIASFSVQSQRYVEEGAFDYVIPPEIENVPEARALFLEAMENDLRQYKRLTEILTEKHRAAFLEQGMEERKAALAAKKRAIEDARFVLPNACATKMIATFNARSLLHFFNVRCCNRAQWEIKALADEMLRLCKAAAPTLFAAAGPSCIAGPCPEGKMTCGKIEEVRRRYRGMDHA